MTNEEVLAYQARERAFVETEIGKAFRCFESACAAMWREDNNDRISYAKLTRLDNEHRATREHLIDLLIPLTLDK